MVAVERKIFWGLIDLNEEIGSEDNPHVVDINPPSKDRDGNIIVKGFKPSTIFEELFHAEQYLFGKENNIIYTPLLHEVEVRVARSYLAYLIKNHGLIIIALSHILVGNS